ncbi:Type III effector HopAM1-1 [Pseudomonas syringae pv. tomato]|nr:Type III effector HopAM1-1 [Pseudomonas syringae pv. tomato]
MEAYMHANPLSSFNRAQHGNLTNVEASQVKSAGTSSTTNIDSKNIEEHVADRLSDLGRPDGGWFFEKSLGTLKNLNLEQLAGIHDVLKLTDGVKNIVSFGAREGGFELAMQFRHDLYRSQHPDENSPHDAATHYLDAISLQSNKFTKLEKLQHVDVFKMQNPFWDVGYKNGIAHAKKMAFFITPEWLGSDFCKQEFQWLSETKNKDIKSAFVIFKDVDLKSKNMTSIFNFADFHKSRVMMASTPPESGLNNVKIENSVDLNFKRLLTDRESWELNNFLGD